MLFQLMRIHNGINKVVNSKKKSEIPSTPNVIFKFKTGIHKILDTNWKVPTDFLNPPQTKRKPRKGRTEKFNAITFINLSRSGFTKMRIRVPINGIMFK